MAAGAEQARAAAEAAARQSYGRLVAYLSARTRDVAGAEDALADAFAAALSRWPETGVPDHPEAWLLTVARRRSIDQRRRRMTGEAGQAHLRLIGEELEQEMAREKFPDDRLALIFACAHPAIEAGVRAPLILQAVLGFDAATIASAFLVSPATMSQRLVRAKSRIKQAGIPFRIPEKAELHERLSAVLEAIYAAFAEGWTDASGAESRRRNLASEAIWLGRLVVDLLPNEPEALCLLSLMLHAEARRPARRSPLGEFVPLSEQDTLLWDAGLIGEADALLQSAGALDGIGRYQIEAAIQSAHAARRFAGRTDWAAIATLYAGLMTLSASPVVAVNHAVAVAYAGALEQGLALLDAIDDARLNEYQPYWAARAELLSLSGNLTEADRAYQLAIGLEPDQAVRQFLKRKRAAVSTR
ncbi:RNA polymerase sigma factor [Aminobacter sp. LjRoot7]|uniref:RNA polymerase sigma factor n=1 Tax=Aminobacter sp. LjRoot7 TaxID=3342335 RepID=UPI003ECD69BC